MQIMTSQAERDAAGVLRGILENPLDDAPRLIYADALDDMATASNRLAEQAQFIRLQVELCREKRKTYQAKISKKINDLMRGAVGFRRYPWLNYILDDLRLGFGADGYRYIHLDMNISRVARDESYELKGECHISRGFIQGIRVSEKYFLANAKRLFECQPITSVVIEEKTIEKIGISKYVISTACVKHGRRLAGLPDLPYLIIHEEQNEPRN